MTTQSQAIHLSRLAAMPCALCGAVPVEIHHLLEGRIKGRKAAISRPFRYVLIATGGAETASTASGGYGMS